MESTQKYNGKEQRFINIVADNLGLQIDEVKYDSHFIDDLGADSLDMAEILIAFEDHFECEVDDFDMERFATVGDFFKYIELHKLE